MCNPTNGTAGTAIGTIQVENSRVRVTEWRFKQRGANTGWHTHDFDYVVVPLFDGKLKITLENGEVITAELQNGVPYYKELGVSHDVVSDNDFECAFIEIELLEKPKSTA